MAVFEKWLTSDLKKPLRVVRMTGELFSQDSLGNLIGVEVLDNGEPASLSGGVTGYIVRNDTETVLVTGTLSGNKASIILPASAYAIVGPISIVIKVGTMTVGALTGYVYRSSTGTYIDPGSVVPSIDELLAKIAEMEAGTAAANAAAAAANTAATETSRVDIAMSKTGNVITVTTTDRNNQQTSRTLQEPTATATKSGEVVTITVVDANGTTTQTLTDPSTLTLLLAENVPGTVAQIQYDTSGNVTGIQHKSGNTVIRADAFTYTDTTITETRTLNTGAILTIMTNLSTLDTTTTYTAA